VILGKGQSSMGKRLTRGLDRRPCERCEHARHLRVQRDELVICMVYNRVSQIWPCSTTRLRKEPRSSSMA
jgi:hypothetical protein